MAGDRRNDGARPVDIERVGGERRILRPVERPEKILVAEGMQARIVGDLRGGAVREAKVDIICVVEIRSGIGRQSAQRPGMDGRLHGLVARGQTVNAVTQTGSVAAVDEAI